LKSWFQHQLFICTPLYLATFNRENKHSIVECQKQIQAMDPKSLKFQGRIPTPLWKGKKTTLMAAKEKSPSMCQSSKNIVTGKRKMANGGSKCLWLWAFKLSDGAKAIIMLTKFVVALKGPLPLILMYFTFHLFK